MKLQEILNPKILAKVVDPTYIFEDSVHEIYNEILHSCDYLGRQLLYKWMETHMIISLDCDDINVDHNINELYNFYEATYNSNTEEIWRNFYKNWKFND